MQKQILYLEWKYKEQFHNVSTFEPNPSQISHGILTGTVVKHKCVVTTDKYVKFASPKNNDAALKKSVPSKTDQNNN